MTTLTTMAVVNQAKAEKVLSLLMTSRMTVAQACVEADIAKSTYLEVLKESPVLQTIRDETQATLMAGVSKAMQAYLNYIERLAEIVEPGSASADRDVVAAGKELRSILETFTWPPVTITRYPSKPSADPDEDQKPANVPFKDSGFRLEGPETIVIKRTTES